MESHPKVDVFVRLVGNLEHYRASQEVQSHTSNLRHVILAWSHFTNHNQVNIAMCRTLTYDLGHPRHYHELVRHVVHLVHPELLQASIQGAVEAVENFNQLKINITAWLHDN